MLSAGGVSEGGGDGPVEHHAVGGVVEGVVVTKGFVLSAEGAVEGMEEFEAAFVAGLAVGIEGIGNAGGGGDLAGGLGAIGGGDALLP